jgi:hypothetical protein
MKSLQAIGRSATLFPTQEGHIIQSMWGSLKGTGSIATMSDDTHLVFWKMKPKQAYVGKGKWKRTQTGCKLGRHS